MKPDAAGRRLYVYYRVPADRLADVTRQVLDMQSALMHRHDGLQADLLRRSDSTGAHLTLMETYRAPTGVTAACALEIERWAQQWSASVDGDRHLEHFEPISATPDH